MYVCIYVYIYICVYVSESFLFHEDCFEMTSSIILSDIVYNVNNA